jgi:DICT domain-containing protein
LSHAIEDEAVARAERPLLFGCFQHERFYRAAEGRWRELARTAERAVVLADFRRRRRPRGAPMELPLRPDDPLMREWVVVCEGATFAACMVGFEHPGSHPRSFETVWSAERAVVREAARTCAELAARAAPDLADELRHHLDAPMASSRDELRSMADLTTRMVAYATAQAAAGLAA